METHDHGRLYWAPYQVKTITWPIHFAKTYETDAPYRIGYSTILSLPFTSKAILFGWWTDNPHKDADEVDLLIAAMGGKVVWQSPEYTGQRLEGHPLDLDTADRLARQQEHYE